MSKLLPKNLTLINILAIVQKDALFKLILNIQKELYESHNDYHLASDKI